MTDVEASLRRFHNVFDLIRNDTPTLPDESTKALRIRLIREEFEELIEAIENDDLPAILQEAVDVVYVTVGACISYGLPFNDGFEVVDTANMAKLSVCPDCMAGWDKDIETCLTCNSNGRVAIRDAGGKILKPPGWQPPDIKSLIHP